MSRSRVLSMLMLIALVMACSPAEEVGETPSDDVEATTPVDDDGNFTPTEICIEAAQAMAAAMSSVSTSFSGAVDEAQAAEIEAQLEAWAADAPDEIKDDFDVFAREMGAFYAELAEIGLVPGATPTAEQLQRLSEAADAVDQEALDEASDNIEAWFEANC